MRHKHLVEFDSEGTRAFQAAELGTGNQRHARALSAGDKHHIAAANLRRVRPNMVFAEVGHPRQDAVDDIAAVGFFRLQLMLLDAGQVLDGIGHTRSRQHFAV